MSDKKTVEELTAENAALTADKEKMQAEIDGLQKQNEQLRKDKKEPAGAVKFKHGKTEYKMVHKRISHKGVSYTIENIVGAATEVIQALVAKKALVEVKS